MQLDKDTLELIKHPIYRTWENIGGDVCAIETGDSISNAEALEVTLDGDCCHVNMYGGDQGNAAKIIRSLFKEHGYDKVEKFLRANIKLVW